MGGEGRAWLGGWEGRGGSGWVDGEGKEWLGGLGEEGVVGWVGGEEGSGWVDGEGWEKRGEEKGGGKEEIKAYVAEMSAEQHNTL